jgi:RNA polymerase sigma-70 factor (ECF subfamily)
MSFRPTGFKEDQAREQPDGPGVAEACDALVRRGRAHADAEDAVQDACVRALQRDAARVVQNPVGYLARIMRNLFIDGSRRRSRDVRLFENADDLALIADERPGPEQFLGDRQLLSRVLAEIDRLPPRCRQAFLAHRFENMSYPVIARSMGISVSAVEKHIAEALMRLEKVRRANGGAS